MLKSGFGWSDAHLEEQLGYTGRALNGYSYLTSSTDDRKHTVISVGQLPDKRIVDASLIVHVVGDRIVIERDVNDRPLIDALQQAGVERQQIILAYAGEPIPDAEQFELDT